MLNNCIAMNKSWSGGAVDARTGAKQGLSAQDRKRRLWLIVIAHLLIVGTFFVASFIWGNFA
jgi:hypothetical protein